MAVCVHVLSRERNQNAAASIVSPTCGYQSAKFDSNEYGLMGTHRYQPMILQNGCLAISKTLGNLLALFAVQHNATKIRVHGMALVETQAVLGDHIELAAKNTPSFAVNAAETISRCARHDDVVELTCARDMLHARLV